MMSIQVLPVKLFGFSENISKIFSELNVGVKVHFLSTIHIKVFKYTLI